MEKENQNNQEQWLKAFVDREEISITRLFVK